MTQPLSPAAQAMLDAMRRSYDHAPTRRALAAAALRAAADQMVPPALCVHNDDLAYCRDQLLAIAAELKGHYA